MCKAKAANAQCSFKLCLRCCIEHTRNTEGFNNCKVKTHRKAREMAEANEAVEGGSAEDEE